MKKLLVSLGPYDDFRGWVRGLVVAGVAGLFLALAGAFGTGDRPFLLRLVYWMAMMGLGYVWGAFVTGQYFRDGKRRTGNRWLDALVSASIIAAPFTVVVWAASTTMFGSHIPPAGLPVLFLTVLIVSLAMVVINMLIEAPLDSVTTHAAPAPPKFLDRLPLKLRGAEVWAVEAEDHYLRLHTSRGQDLILLRLADAVAELEGIEGAQVHRSWWVARDAITDAKRGDGRAMLTLKDGAQVPVSRTYAALLRERGWI